MPLEIEIKFRVHGHGSVSESLARLGFKPVGVVTEEDQYLNGVDRDFEIGRAHV